MGEAIWIRAAGLTCAAWLSWWLLSSVKLKGFGVRSAPKGLDLLLWALIEGLTAWASSVSVGLGLFAGLLVTLLFTFLWLDAMVFHVFTIELGPGGAAGVVPSTLYAELMGMRRARTLLRTQPAFTLLPLMVGTAHASFLVSRSPATARVLSSLLGLWAAFVFQSLLTGSQKQRRGAIQLSRSPGPALTAPRFESCSGSSSESRSKPALRSRLVASLWRPPVRGEARRSRLVASLWRPPVRGEALEWRPQHRHALEALRTGRAGPRLNETPASTSRSPLFGLLRGADVLIYTIESLGSAHVQGLADGAAAAFPRMGTGVAVGAGTASTRAGASMPCLTDLLARGVRSQHHFCVCPLTNEAHVALHESCYAPLGGAQHGGTAWQSAGYQQLYLTSVDARAYGLARIVEGAGFKVLDRSALRASRGPGLPHPHPHLSEDAKDERRTWDGLLASAGLDAVEARRDGRPLFLHVHTGDSHLPYTVAHPRKGQLPREDRPRYLRCLEEADAHLAEFLSSLKRRGMRRNLLVIVSADHGQSFGELGYWSHGSAVTREQMLVPFVMQHEALPRRELAFSSHLDVMPTLMDLLGIEPPAEGRQAMLGRSMLLEARPPPALVLWAGRPSRSTASNYGLVLGQKKWMVDSVLDRVHEMGWNDEAPRMLEGEEKAYIRAMVTWALSRQGLG